MTGLWIHTDSFTGKGSCSNHWKSKPHPPCLPGGLLRLCQPCRLTRPPCPMDTSRLKRRHRPGCRGFQWAQMALLFCRALQQETRPSILRSKAILFGPQVTTLVWRDETHVRRAWRSPCIGSPISHRHSFCCPYGVMPVIRVTALWDTQRYGFQSIYSCPSLDTVYNQGHVYFLLSGFQKAEQQS